MTLYILPHTVQPIDLCCCFCVGHGVFNYLRSRISLCVASASALLSLSVLKALLPVGYSIPTMSPCHLASDVLIQISAGETHIKS